MIGETKDISRKWTVERVLILSLFIGSTIGMVFMAFTMP